MVRPTCELPGIATTEATSAALWSLPGVAVATGTAPGPLGTLELLLAVTWVLVDGADRPLATGWAALPLRVFILKQEELLHPNGICHTYHWIPLNNLKISLGYFMQVHAGEIPIKTSGNLYWL